MHHTSHLKYSFDALQRAAPFIPQLLVHMPHIGACAQAYQYQMIIFNIKKSDLSRSRMTCMSSQTMKIKV